MLLRTCVFLGKLVLFALHSSFLFCTVLCFASVWWEVYTALQIVLRSLLVVVLVPSTENKTNSQKNRNVLKVPQVILDDHMH